MTSSRTIAIVGTGYVGMASAIGLASLGHLVVGYDIIRERVRGLAQGVTPYHEPGIGSALRDQLTAGTLSFVEDIAVAVRGADFVVVAVGTPALADGAADLSYLDGAIESLAQCVDGATIVLRSTVPVGTTERVSCALAGRAAVVYAPEFLREGTALPDFFNPDRIVIGCEDLVAAEGYSALFASLDVPRVITSFRNAELIKAFSNAFLATKISFANEVANFCDAADADALEVLTGVGLDRRIGPQFLRPGIGFGGPCFEKDVKSLRHQAAKRGVHDDVLTATLATNDRQPSRIRQILEHELGGLRGKKIGVWGLTFKGDTDDVRDSLAIRVVDDLLLAGAELMAYDPAVRGAHALVRCPIVEVAFEAIDGADALVVLTDWTDFTRFDPREIVSRLRTRLIVDGRNVLDHVPIGALGARYRGIGRRTRVPVLATIAEEHDIVRNDELAAS